MYVCRVLMQRNSLNTMYRLSRYDFTIHSPVPCGPPIFLAAFLLQPIIRTVSLGSGHPLSTPSSYGPKATKYTAQLAS